MKVNLKKISSIIIEDCNGNLVRSSSIKSVELKTNFKDDELIITLKD